MFLLKNMTKLSPRQKLKESSRLRNRLKNLQNYPTSEESRRLAKEWDKKHNLNRGGGKE